MYKPYIISLLMVSKLLLVTKYYNRFVLLFLEPERSEGASGFTMMFIIFIFLILYTKFLPE